jgi:hypothetical protein
MRYSAYGHEATETVLGKHTDVVLQIDFVSIAVYLIKFSRFTLNWLVLLPLLDHISISTVYYMNDLMRFILEVKLKENFETLSC